MSGKLIHNLKRKREEECSSNSSKNSSPAGSPLTIISQASVIVNPSCSSFSSASSNSFCLINGNSTNSSSTQSISLNSEYNNKPGTSSSSSTAVQSSSTAITKTISTPYDTTHTNDIEQLKIIAQDAKREKHDFYVDTPESSNDGTEGLLPPTPPSESSDSQNEQQQQQSQPQILQTTRNTFLVEALKRIVELQHELEEQDNQQYEDEDHEVSNIINQPLPNRSEYNYQQQQQLLQHESFNAEALGFAMCARETLLFLQSEGIPENSEIYRALREKLVGKSPQEIPI